MKKVFLFLMSALVCGIMMTSCGKDDGEETVALTGLTVSPATVETAVGGTQQLTVTKVPTNATDVTYTWTSSNTSVATVDEKTGLVTVVGIGEATITVTAGTVKAEAKVTGTAKTLTVADADGNTAGTYLFADEDIIIALTATIDPAGTALTWAADVRTVTVTPGANGSATVTIVDGGNATITVTGGGLTATYTISTQSVLETAVGYWEFDDPNNLLKATIGNDLALGGWDDKEREIAPSAGPTANNGAINIPRYNYLKCIHGIAPNGEHSTDPNIPLPRVNEFTIMFDVMEEDASKYHALYLNEVDESLNIVDEACVYLKSGGRIGGGDLGNSPNESTESGKWYRIVFSVKVATEGGYYDFYLNGELLKETSYTTPDHRRYTIHPAGILFFADSRPEKGEGGDGYDFGDDGLHVAAIAIWDRPLTAAEIASLGMFEVAE